MSTKLDDHPTVAAVRRRGSAATEPPQLQGADLRRLCLECGADDVGFVALRRPELDDQRADILRDFPGTRSLISIVVRMHRENIRSPARSAANLEFHHAIDQAGEAARRITEHLARRQIRAFYPSPGFPMEMEREKIWLVSHKPVAVAAGLGRMGIHRNVIHPRFGNFILLATVLVAADIDEESRPVDFNPCLECKLCVAACPVGAIAPDGHFDFAACYTHNYREFMSGFGDWVENVVASGSPADYRSRVTPPETASMWQSLSFGANYKAAYCLAVCPAGEDVIGPFLHDRTQFVSETVRPLQDKPEPVYVVKGSDAETRVRRRFPHKTLRFVHNGLRARSVGMFLRTLPVMFQRDQAAGIDATFHFTFMGEEERKATVVIRDQAIHVEEGLNGTPGLHVHADSRTWIRFLNRDTNLIAVLLRRKIRLKGSPRLLLAFGRCFPS